MKWNKKNKTTTAIYTSVQKSIKADFFLFFLIN